MSRPADPNQTIDETPQQDFVADSPGADAPEQTPTSLAHLKLLEEIARGGMGAILRGRDVTFGRDVAVKVLLQTHLGKTEFVQRFVEEAQIAGQLQHPGVAPVYELGRFADQRPYFTMKLVKGETLAALLSTRPDPAADRARFVGVFAQVCQTLAYAHARGVIHRDLKPANIMVGAFGEVQVMDWGLAKVLKEGGADEPASWERQRAAQISVIQTQRSEGSGASESATVTQAGSVLGTPAYMAPEQARGVVELVDARADVFGLGALLCEILTGEPPFTGKNAEAMRKAQTAQLDDAFARLDGCGADGELAGLARRCLAAEPWDRPRDAGEVTAAVTAYQNSVVERLRQAELARAAEAARTEEAKATATQERKARRLTVGLAVCVLALLTVGAAGGLWVQRQAAAQAAEALRQREAVVAALEKAHELQHQAHWAEALAVLEQTRDRLGEAGPADLRQQVEQATADLTLVDRLEAIRLRRVVLVEGKRDNQGAERDYAETFQDAGMGAEGEEAETTAARIRESAVGEYLVAALDDWAGVTTDPKRRTWLLETARRADPDPWRDRFRNAKVWSDRASLEALAKELLDDEKQLAKQKPQLLTALGSALGQAKADAAPLLAAAQALHPEDFWLNFDLGNALYEAGRRPESVGFFRGAVALRPSAASVHNNLGNALNSQSLEEAVREYHIALALDPKFGSPHNNLGLILHGRQQLGEAILEYRTAIDLNPKIAVFHNNLGSILRDKKQLDEAMKEFRIAIDLGPDRAMFHNNLGNLLRERKEWDGASKEYRLAIDLEPKDASPHGNLGDLLREKKQPDEAMKEYRVAVKLDPAASGFHNSLGDLLREKMQLDEAIEEYRLAVDLDHQNAQSLTNLVNALRDKQQLDEAILECRIAVRLNPKDAWPHKNFGDMLRAMKQPDEAMKEYRIGVKLDPKDGSVHNSLGDTLREKKHLDEAIQEYRIAIELDPKNAGFHNSLAGALRDNKQLDEAIKESHLAIELDPKNAWPHLLLGDILREKQQLDDAMKEYRLAIELDPKQIWPHNNLGDLLREKKQPDEAMKEYRVAIQLDLRNSGFHNSLGDLLREKMQLDEAIQEYRIAIELNPKNAGPHNNLGDILHDKKQLDEAIKEYRIAIDLDPNNGGLHHNLGDILTDKKQPEEAIKEYRLAIALDPQNAWHHNNLGDLLSEKKQWDEAIKEYRAVIDLDPKFVWGHHKLGDMLREKKQWDEAIKEYRAAIVLDPKQPSPHHNLGDMLREKKQPDEAIKEYRIAADLDRKNAGLHNKIADLLRDEKQLDEAIQEYRIAVGLDPKYAAPHIQLGDILRDRKQPKEASKEYRAASDLVPDDAGLHYSLAASLEDDKQPDEAIKEYRLAIEKYFDNAWYHTKLGDMLRDKQETDEAIKEYRLAIGIDAKNGWPHIGLGNILCAKRQTDEGIKEYRLAVGLDLKNGWYHYVLGNAFKDQHLADDAIREYQAAVEAEPAGVGAQESLAALLLQVGRYAEARDAARRRLELLAPDDPLRPSVGQQLQQCEQLLAVEQKLAAVLEGKAQPADDAERLALARLCRQPFKKFYAASYRFYSEAFAHDAKLPDDMQTGDRYNAACVAALASRGQGADAGKLDDKERARLRKQAVAWLRADLAYWTNQATNEEPAPRELARQTLKHWQEDADLSGLRDATELAKLPADEQKACKELWTDVQALLDKTDVKK
jgi:eukaryotic-like serine/threonine-protein kinase